MEEIQKVGRTQHGKPTFADRLRNLREGSQQKLAKELGVTQAWVSNIERGVRIFRSEGDVRTYARALGTDEDDLVSDWQGVTGEEQLFVERPSVLPESRRREKEAAEQWQKEAETYLAPGISLAAIKNLLLEDETATTVIRAMCQLQEERQAGKR